VWASVFALKAAPPRGFEGSNASCVVCVLFEGGAAVFRRWRPGRRLKAFGTGRGRKRCRPRNGLKPLGRRRALGDHEHDWRGVFRGEVGAEV